MHTSKSRFWLTWNWIEYAFAASKAGKDLPQFAWRRSLYMIVYGIHEVVRFRFLLQSSLHASGPLSIESSHTPPSGAVFLSLMPTRIASAEPMLALAQKLMPRYM